MNKRIVILLIAVLTTLLYYAPILHSGGQLGIQDWDQNFAWNEFVRTSILKYHQFPFWDPYRCGGTAHFANPQISVLSIQTLFVLVFGTVMGIKIAVFTHGFIGFIGAYLLARYYKLSTLASIMSAILFSFNGIVASFLSTGMIPFMNYVYTPYILYCFLRGKEHARWLVAGAFIFALSYFYSSHVLLLLIVYLALYAAFSAIIARDSQPVIRFLIFGVFSALFAAPKLALSLQLMLQFPRHVHDPSGYTLHSLGYFLTSWSQNLFRAMSFTDFSFAADENSVYLGIVPLLLMAISVLNWRKYLTQYLPELFTFISIGFLMMGDTFSPSPFQALKQLPLYASFGVAQRFRLIFILPCIIFAGLGFDHATDGPIRRYRNFLWPVLAGIIYIDLLLFSHTNFLSQSLIIKDTFTPTVSETFTQISSLAPPAYTYVQGKIPHDWEHSKVFSPYSHEFIALRENIGTVSCYDAITDTVFAVGNDDESYRGEWYTALGDRKVTLVSWTPHSISLAVERGKTNTADMLVLNQNYYPGWYVHEENQLRPAYNYKGLLASPINEHSQRITFVYKPYRGLLDQVLHLLRSGR